MLVDMQGQVCIEQSINCQTNDQVFEVPVVNLWPGNYGIQINFAGLKRGFASKFSKI